MRLAVGSARLLGSRADRFPLLAVVVGGSCFVACGSSGSTGDDGVVGSAGTSTAGSGATEAGGSDGGSSQSGAAGSARAGAGESGQSGSGEGEGGHGGGESNAGSPGQSPLLRTIAATPYGACALDAGGEIHCWGANPEGWVVPAGAFVELVGGVDRMCAIREDRTFECFDEPRGMPGPFDYAPRFEVLDVDTSRERVCAIDVTGTTTCGHSGEAFATMPLVPPSEPLSQLTMGVEFACGLREADGTIACWGNPDFAPGCEDGQLDAPSGSFVAVSAGQSTICAITVDGTLTCWGAGQADDDPSALCDGGELNFGQGAPPSGTFKSVSVDYNHACGVRTDGTIECWGAGTADACTLETDSNCRQSLPPAGTFEQVVTGRTHSCAMTAQRKVLCWGNDGEEGRTTVPEEFL